MNIIKIPFRKMNGLGNDFVIIDRRSDNCDISEDLVRSVANRKSGIGCDQLIVMENSDKADIEMRAWNSDGSEVETCGNALRCVGAIILSEKKARSASIDTKAGISQVYMGDKEHIVSVDMGKPKLNWQDIPLSEEFHDTRKIELHVGPYDNPILYNPSVVNVGNPHCVFWVKDLDCYSLKDGGPMLENHILFPQGANISLAKVIDDNNIKIKVWERGSGITKACGSAACAVAVCAIRKNYTKRNVNIELPGGILNIVWDAKTDHILMTGEYAFEYASYIEIEE